MPRKLISIVTPTFNEQDNVSELYKRIRSVMSKLEYEYEHIVIDNSSQDETVNILRNIARSDKNLKIIVNSRNFGQIRSPFYGMLQASGQACISLSADLQDPPEKIPELIKSWESGFKVCLLVKESSHESLWKHKAKETYGRLLSWVSNVPLLVNVTGSGLYDQCVLDIFRKVEDPLPYFRGLVSEIGYPISRIMYTQPKRKFGRSSNTFFTLYDYAMLGIVSYTRMPLRIMTFVGAIVAVGSIFVALIYLLLKIVYWDDFDFGTAPMLIGIFFFGGLNSLFVGVLGEYIGSIHYYLKQRGIPMVVERERINF